MTLSAAFIDSRVHSAQAMRTADAGLLSLALMDARSRTLGWLAAFDGLRFNPAPAQADPPWWRAGQAGWFQEHWIARNVQRGRGAAATADGLRYSSVEPRADAWFSPLSNTRAQRWQLAPPQPAELHDYLAHTLDITLALLDKAEPTDDGLYFFRLAALHEDMQAHWSAYPKLWNLRRPDANIDHRRVANLMTYFARGGDALRVSDKAAMYRPGDLVAWRLDSGRLHIGVVTDQLAPSRNPLMAHNIGERGAK